MLALLLSASGLASGNDLPTRLGAIVSDEKLTGLAWALIDDRAGTSLGAVGLRDASGGTPFTTDTRFHVGSLAKAVLATGVLELAREGRLDLDAPAERYLPDIAFSNPWADTHVVTVRHLLDHTAGLNDAHLWQVFSTRALPDAPLMAAFPDPDVQLAVRAPPGTRFSYSNIGYTLLGLVIESVSGQGYERWLDEQLLPSLGMLDSTFAYTTQLGDDADEKLAWGHFDDGAPYAARPMFLRPAGQLTATAGDLARFAEHLLTDRGMQSADRNGMSVRGRPSTTEAASAGLVAGYALGLGRRDRHGVVGYCHGGNTVGFRAMLCVFPGERKAFAYGVNTDSETADYGRIDRALIDTLGIAPAVRPETVDLPVGVEQWLGWYTPNPNRFQSFAYLDRVFGAVSLQTDGSSLVLSGIDRGSRRLRPVGNGIFSADDRATASHVLLRGRQGGYLFSDGFSTFEKTPSTLLWAHWTSVAAGLAGLLWLLLAAVVQLVRRWRRFPQHEVAPASAAIAGLAVPIPLFMAQSFMTLGDVTAASTALAAATLLLPAGALWTLARCIRNRRSGVLTLMHGLAAVLVVQWCLVLALAGFLPLRLWA